MCSHLSGAGLGAKGEKTKSEQNQGDQIIFPFVSEAKRGGGRIKREGKSSHNVAIWCNLGTSEGSGFRDARARVSANLPECGM